MSLSLNNKIEASSSLNKDVVREPPQKNPNTNTSQETAVYPRFLVVKRSEGDFTKVNPFIIEKNLYSLVGTPKNVRKVKDGLLVETVSAAQSKRLLEVKQFGEHQVEVTAHHNLNTCRGVIYCPDLLNCSVEDIADGLKDQGVISVRRIKTKKEGNLIDTANHILTFNTTTLPKRVKAAFYSLQVRLYIPPPMRCFKCQKFGHTSMRCNEEQVCVCGKPLHLGNPCQEPLTCINCNGSHSARSRNCPTYKTEAAIQEIKVKENIPYFEAKKKVIVPTPVSNLSYAAAVSSTPKIDYTPLVDQLIPKIVAALTSIYSKEVMMPPELSTTMEKRKRTDSPPGQETLSSGDETSLSSQVAELRQKPKRKSGWPKGKSRKQRST